MYTRKLKLCAENDFNYHFSDVEMNTTNVREPSLVDEFYKEEISQGDNPVVIYSDPIYMLFDQQRLDKLGKGAVDMFINSLSQGGSNPLAELRKNCSDDDLLTMIKSRHLQQPSEILAWARYMEQNITDFQSEVAKLVAEKQTELASHQVASQSNVEPNPN